MDILSNIEETRKRYEMLPPGSAVLVGFSGGADSVTLLSCLCTLAPRYRWKVAALHFNHCIRGEEADRDEEFCRAFCEERGIPFYVRRRDVPMEAKKSGEGLEACGRRLRYAWFEEMADSLFPDRETFICTAHNANDSVETALFHFARGTSLSGMTGIAPVRGRIVRPLIRCFRDEIEQYCRENNLSYCTDSTNRDVHYSRNRIRLEVLPELEQIHPAALRSMARSIEQFARDESFLREQTAALLRQANLDTKPLSYSIIVLQKAPEALRLRALAQILRDFSGCAPEEQHVAAAAELLENGGQIQVPSGAVVRAAQGRIFCAEQGETAPFRFHGEKILRLPYGIFHAEETFDCAQLENACDYDKMNGNFIVRNRRPGDRFRVPGRKISKTLKALFQERGIPKEQRSAVTVVECSGKIAWLEGFGPSEAFQAGPGCRHGICFSVERVPLEEQEDELVQ